MYSIFKRGADILISIIALPFMLLLTIVLGILIYLEDEGPIFYKSARVGRGGKKLDMLKFRSMKVNAPDSVSYTHLALVMVMLWHQEVL